MKSHFPILALAGVVAAQSALWGQCGGQGFTGSTSCVSGSSCVFVNNWYSQCQPGSAGAPSSTLTTVTKSAPASTSKPAPTGSSSANIRYVGRVNPATKELTWPSTGIAFTFTGTTASIGISSVTGTNSADLIIDGGAPIVIANVAGTSISTGTLSQGKHTVELRKRSEANFGSIFLTGTVTTDGTLNASAAPTRRIEIVGDSISVGYGLDGVNPCTNTAALEDSPKTYGALAANSLGADYSIVAWSGKGVTRNYPTGGVDTSPLLPELYTRYGANDADNSYPFPASWVPDAVVVNLGTNDFAYQGARDPLSASAYTATMVKFVQSIQAHYPNADFFLMTSPLLSDTYPTAADAQHTTQSNALKAVVAQVGAKAHLVDWPTQGADVGCDYHPNAATNAAEATVLAAAIKAVEGW